MKLYASMIRKQQAGVLYQQNEVDITNYGAYFDENRSILYQWKLLSAIEQSNALYISS